MPDYANLLLDPISLFVVAGLIQAGALLFQDLVRIRILLLAGSIVYLFCFVMSAQTLPWQVTTAILLVSLANLVGLVMLLMRRSARLLPPDQLALFSMFGGVQPTEFRAFMHHGQIHSLTKSAVLTEVGKVPNSLYFVIDGTVDVEQGQGVFALPPKHFVGEISLMLGTPASATVTAKAGSQIVEWPRKRLASAMAHQPKLKIAIESLLARDMARKVAVSASRIDSKYANTDPTIGGLFQ